VAANLNAYDFIYTKQILTKSEQRKIIFKSEQQWQINKLGEKKRSNMVVFRLNKVWKVHAIRT